MRGNGRARREGAGDPPGSGGGRADGGRGVLPALGRELRPDTPALRTERVEAIRRDLLARRRRRAARLVLRLGLFVLLPTLAAAGWLWGLATPLYRSEAVVMVQNADVAGAGASPVLGGLFSGGTGAAAQESVAVEAFLLSRDVLARLEAEHGFSAHFAAPGLDALVRLPPGVPFEEALEHYRRMVTVRFDPAEGVIGLALVATEPAAAQRFAQALIGYAEEMVDRLSDRIHADALAAAEAELAKAEARLVAAQDTAARLRKTRETFSVEGAVAQEMQLIAGLESERAGLLAKLANLRRVAGEDDPRVVRLGTQAETLHAQIAARRARITGTGGGSLADIGAELARADLSVETARALFAAAIETREAARADLARQHRYLAVIVAPSRPDAPNHPDRPALLLLAFLGALGIYVIGSLTLSLIREQASL